MNCKPGDLAIVISDHENPENIGIICKVIEFIGYVPPDECCPIELFNSWDVESIGRPFEWSAYDSAQGCLIEDSDLKPISGLPDTEGTDIEQPIKEVA